MGFRNNETQLAGNIGIIQLTQPRPTTELNNKMIKYYTPGYTKTRTKGFRNHVLSLACQDELLCNLHAYKYLQVANMARLVFASSWDGYNYLSVSFNYP